MKSGNTEEANQERSEGIYQGWDMSHVGENTPLASLYHTWETEQEQVYDVPGFIILRDEDMLLTEQELQVAEKHMGLQLLSAARERYQLLANKEGVLNRKAAAKPFIYVSHNQMKAWVLVFPPIHGGEAIRMEQLTDILEEHGVVEGIDKEVLYEIVQKELYFQIFPVAKGRTPENGKSGYVVEEFPRAYPEAEREQLSGIANYLAKRYIQPISKGDVIARAVPPVYGRNGVNVLGHEVCPPAEKEVLPLVGNNTLLKEDGTLVAEMDGHVFFKYDRFHVQPLCVYSGDMFHQDTVIDFDGDVTVDGDVSNGVVIQATGTIVVDGAVEGAVLRAGGDVIVTAGVLGDDTLVRAGGSVFAKYLDSVTVYAYGSVKADCILNSNIFSEDKIIAVDGLGTINGGHIIAANAVFARRLGSRAERVTQVALGEYPCQKDEYEEITAKMEELQRDISAGSEKLKQWEQEQPVGERSVQYSKFRLQQAGSMNKLQRLQVKRNTLKMCCEDVGQCVLQAETVYSGAVIRIGEAVQKVEKSVTSCTVQLNKEHEIMFIPEEDILSKIR